MTISKEFLIRLKLSSRRQYQIAQEAGVCPGTLSGLLSGARRMGKFDHRIVAVGRVLGLTPEECFESGKNVEGKN